MTRLTPEPSEERCDRCKRTAGEHNIMASGTGTYCPGFYVAPKPQVEGDSFYMDDPSDEPLTPDERATREKAALWGKYMAIVRWHGVTGAAALMWDAAVRRDHTSSRPASCLCAAHSSHVLIRDLVTLVHDEMVKEDGYHA